jgi:hypothetical protein
MTQRQNEIECYEFFPTLISSLRTGDRLMKQSPRRASDGYFSLDTSAIWSHLLGALNNYVLMELNVSCLRRNSLRKFQYIYIGDSLPYPSGS